MKVLFVRAKHDGVGHYRVSIPFLALKDRGHEVDILDAPDKGKKRVYSGWFAGYDICLIQNLVDPTWVEVVKTLPDHLRPKVLGCIDDLVGGLDKSNPLYKEYDEARPHFIECMKLCDGMIFSTEEIASHYGGLNPRYRIVPNFLDIPGLREWDIPEKRTTDRLTIGWLGGTQHVNDELPMAEGLRAVLKKHPGVMFAFCGNAQLGYLWKKSIGIYDEQFIFLRPTEFDGYQTRISHFDIGVAPLRDTEFNRCKSDLRLLEYGAWGVPYVASDIAPYRRFHEQSGMAGGFLAATPVMWESVLTDLIESKDVRGWVGCEGRTYVRNERGHYACGKAWEEALSALINPSPIPDCSIIRNVPRNAHCPCGSGAKYKRCCYPAWG